MPARRSPTRRPSDLEAPRGRGPPDETATSSASGSATSSRDAPPKTRAATRGEQHRLGEDEQRGDDAERRVEREQRTHGARAADEARVEPAHRGPRRRSRVGARSAGDGAVLAAEPCPEDVVRPALVEQDDRRDDQRHDGHHLERVVRRGGVVDGEAVREVVARDHDARVEAREDRGHDEEGAGRREHERPAAAGEPDADDGAEQCGDREQRGKQRREDVLVVAVDRDRDGPDQEPRADDGRRDREPACAPPPRAGTARRSCAA